MRIVDLDRGHPERPGRLQVAPDVVEEDHLRGRDTFLVCADFDDYVTAEAQAAQAYQDPRDWARRSLCNIVGASAFSSDNTIRKYASEIWRIQPVKTDLGCVSLGPIVRSVT